MLQTEAYLMIVIYDRKTFKGQEPTLEWSTRKAFHFSWLLPYPQTLYYEKACNARTNTLAYYQNS